MRLCVEVLGGLFAVAVLVVGVAVWRLSEGPVRTDFLTPYLQAAINQAGGNTIEIGGTFLVWEEGSRGLVLHAAEVVVRDTDKKLIASLPEVAFELSTSAILGGTLAPNQIEIIAPRIRLLRATDGSISFGDDASVPPVSTETVENATEGTGEDLVLGRMIRELMRERQPGSPLSYLDEVRIRDGQIYVRDDRLGLSWAAPSADISLRRDIAGLAGDISLSFAGRRDPATFDAAFLFDKKAGVVDLAAGFSDISLAALGRAFPLLAPVSGVTSRISGSVSTSLSLDGTLGHTGFDLQGLAGTLRIPGVDMEPLAIREMIMRGRYDGDESRFDLDEARVNLGSAEVAGPIFSIAGVFDYDPRSKGWEISTDAALEGVPLAELPTYWPASIAEAARDWVLENVTQGLVDKATAALEVRVPDGDFAAAEVINLTGTMQYRGVEVYYLRPLAPIQSIAGTAEFDLDALHFAAQSGRLGNLALGVSKVDITNFKAAYGRKDVFEQLTIDAKAIGPVAETLALLEHPRLDLLSRLGFSAAGSGGTVSADLAFQFPLSKDLAFDDVTLQVEATVQEGELKNVLLGQDITEGRLAVSLDENGMRLAGPLALGGVPLSVQWQESFANAAKVRSAMEAEIPRIGDAGRANFGLDIGDALQGPLAATVSLVATDSGLTTLQVSTDLRETTISLPEIHWRKEPGVDGSLAMTIEMDSSGPLSYRDIVLQAGDLVARGRATPGRDRGGLGAIELDRVAFGRSNLQDVGLQLGGDGIDVQIGQGILDAAPFIKDGPQEAAGSQRPVEQAVEEPRNFEPLTIKAPKLDVLYFAEGRRLERVNLELRRTQEGWDTIRLSGSIPEQYWSPRDAPATDKLSSAASGEEAPQAVTAELNRRYLQFSFAPDATGSGQRLLANSDDLGALLRATNITDTVVGGRIQVTGQSVGPSPTYPIEATVAARDFVMVNAPVMAKLLTVASFTGVLELLSGEGIGFQGMDGEFVLDDGIATTELMRIYGASLGFTAKGEIDFDRDAIDLTGVVVPAYSINNFISKIPLLGTLLTGGEGEGIIAVAYSVKGGVDDPDVSVNPLTALTPGFLRNIFTASPGDQPSPTAPERIDR